jgi:hypothetical protein
VARTATARIGVGVMPGTLDGDEASTKPGAIEQLDRVNVSVCAFLAPTLHSTGY